MLDKNGNFTQSFTLRICKDFQVEGQTVMENDYVNTYDPSTGTWTEGEPQNFIFGKVSDLGRGTISLLGSEENAYRFEIKFGEKIADRAYQLINVGVNNAEAWIAYCGVDGIQLGDENSVGTAKYILSHLAESVRGIKIEGKSIAEHLEIAGTIEDFGGFGSTLGIVVNVTEDLKGLEFLLSDLYAASDKGFVSGSEKYEVLISSFVGLNSEGKADISLGCPINIECDGATGKWINLYAPAAESIEIIEVKPLQEAGALLEFEVKFNQNLTTEKYEYLTTRIDLVPDMLAWFVGANANIADEVKGQSVFDRLGVKLLDKISVNGITVGQMSLDIITIFKDMEDAIGAEAGSIGSNAVNVSVERDILKVSISKEVAQYYGIALNSDGAVMFSAALKIDAGISSYLDSNCILENGGKYIVSFNGAGNLWRRSFKYFSYSSIYERYSQ